MSKGSSLYINGRWCDGAGVLLRSCAPIGGRCLWQKHQASIEQVEEAYAAARSAQLEWAKLGLARRLELIEAFAQLLRENQNALMATIAAETGKPEWEAATEVTAMINKIGISKQAQQERAGTKHNGNLHLYHRAHGVMAVLGPYNFPGHIPNGHIVPALLAGNTIVFKPSEETPLVAEQTVALWHKADLPCGVLNLLQGGGEIGATLCRQDINGLLFTGSYNTGKRIHQSMAARPEVLLALEMGGNNPLIVDEVENFNTAVQIILKSAYLSAGQRCTSARRLIVVENNNTEELFEILQRNIDHMIVGPSEDKAEPFMGALINDSMVQRLLRAQQELLSSGGRALRSMRLLKQDSNLLSPGLIDMSAVNMPPDEEWFGPLLQVFRVKDLQQAIALANNTKFGLAAGLICDNPEKQNLFIETIHAGVIAINQPTAGASSALPFGGVGYSGNHRPSAYYAADYCAWPQSLMFGPATCEQNTEVMRGIRQ